MKMVYLLYVIVSMASVFGATPVSPAPDAKMETPYVTPMDSAILVPWNEDPPSPVAKPADSIATSKVVLWILPLVVQKAETDDEDNLDSVTAEEKRIVEAAVRLGASQNGEYWVSSKEETVLRLAGEDRYGQSCFSKLCLTTLAQKIGIGAVLGVVYARHDTLAELKLVLLDASNGEVRLAERTSGNGSPDSLIPFARKAVRCLLAKGTCPERSDITWLNPRDSVDNHRRFGWAGSGMLMAATGLALIEGQLLQRDERRNAPASAVLSDGGGRSFLRGFFAAPTLGARYAAMGGAGIAHVNNGLALLMNPAGVGQTQGENVVAAKRTLPGGTPSLFVAWAGPLMGKWSQGLGVQYEGDALASETTLEGALAFDLSEFGKYWEGVKGGVELKLYLAEVGRSGTGLDRSTGHSVGAGLDIGLQARVTEKITAAFTVKDLLSILRHSNTLTNLAQGEVLPPEYRLGTAYRASPTLLLLMDGQKGLYADQADHVRIGAEQALFRYFSLRGGMHQIFGREAVRKLAIGFGINTLPIGKGSTSSPLGLNYSYEFSLNEAEPLGGGQQFSLEMGF